jgi:hypothetical protein
MSKTMTLVCFVHPLFMHWLRWTKLIVVELVVESHRAKVPKNQRTTATVAKDDNRRSEETDLKHKN